MQPTRNTLSEDIRVQSVELLSNHLPATIDLHAQMKQAHWSVRGPARVITRTSHGGPSTPPHLWRPASEPQERIAIWVNEGGRGGDVNR